MPIRSSTEEQRCSGCAAAIAAGELHRGPAVWDDQAGHRWCWPCACQGGGLERRQARKPPEPIPAQGALSGHQRRLMDAAARGARRQIKEEDRQAERQRRQRRLW